MTGIELYSKTAASNNSATPNGWPEGQAPSTVNDCARQMMSSIRTWYESAEWINWGDTCVYASGTSFTIAGTDATTRYTASRRIKAVGSSTGTIYGAISSSSFSTNTTVNITWDSGSLSNETLTISLAINDPTHNSLALGTNSVSTASIAANAVTNAKLAQMAANTVKGNNTGSTANATDIALSASTLLGMGSSGNIAALTATAPLSIGASAIALNMSQITNSLSGDVSLNNTGTYFDGPSVAQGTSGTWFVSGAVTLSDQSNAGGYNLKLWDGTTVIASSRYTVVVGTIITASLSGYITSPAGNLRISVNENSFTTGKIIFNGSGNSKDSTISAIRIG